MGLLPQNLLTELRPVLDLLQMYGLQQRQFPSSANAALAENGIITITPLSSFILFGVQGIVTKTATMTALQFSIAVGRNIAEAIVVYSPGPQNPFGATETGACVLGTSLPYPRVLPQGWSVFFRLDILGTDATANCSVTAEIGLLG